MSKKIKKIELLAPAGDFRSLIAGINAGCDAVYFGLQEFNMRDRAKNFKMIDLPKIKKIANSKNIKVYLTLNTIIFDKEINKIEKIIKKSKPYVNAIICSDVAVMLLCKKNKIPFHVSTQCSVSNSKTAKFYKKLGAQRIVLARELNLKQIKRILKIISVEVFIHGAMCVAVSGRCFTSQFLFGESANRGRCLQPCRRFYTVKDEYGNLLKVTSHYIFSAKDLCTLSFIDKLKKSGISSFKIEGRNREPEYVDTVVRVYRKAIDNKLTKKQIADSQKELEKVYNRGYSDGFFIKAPTSDDFSNFDNNNATQKKEFIGKINHYYKKIKVGLIFINSGSLKVGDMIMVVGNKTSLFYYKIKSIEVNKKKIKEAKKGLEVGIEIPLCRKGDEVYKIINNI